MNDSRYTHTTQWGNLRQLPSLLFWVPGSVREPVVGSGSGCCSALLPSFAGGTV
jgi:hypothetical protein